MCTECEYESFYGTERYAELKNLEQALVGLIDAYSNQFDNDDEMRPVIYSKTRVKTPKSLAEKAERKGIGLEDAKNGIGIRDIVGGRVVCPFIDDVYAFDEWISANSDWFVICRKDYIMEPKESGYRSLNIIVERAADGATAEIQIRTIAMDFWAALEHRMRYKKNIRDSNIVWDELRRCSDEIASLDIRMGSIRDLIETS